MTFNPKRLIDGSFLNGILLTGWSYIFIQDFLGKEKYLQWCTDHWVNIPWWVSGTLGLLYILLQCVSRKKPEPKPVTNSEPKFKVGTPLSRSVLGTRIEMNQVAVVDTIDKSWIYFTVYEVKKVGEGRLNEQ